MNISQIENFLIQQAELYGDEVAVDRAELIANSQPAPLTTDQDQDISLIHQLLKNVQDCVTCGDTVHRNQLVFEDGSSTAKIAVIGLFPSTEDDKAGSLFSGDVGKLLDSMFRAIGLSRNDLYFCNLLKCTPTTEKYGRQAKTCRPFLIQQLDIQQPKVILCMGQIVAQSLLKTREHIQDLRNRTLQYNNIRVFVTHHPAELLTDAQLKRPAWEDLKKFKEYYSQMDR